MAQFDVRRMSGDRLVLECQADLLSHFATRLVVPLVHTMTGVTVARLNPTFEIEGKSWTMATQLAFALPARDLGPVAASLADERLRIIDALDVLLTGV